MENLPHATCIKPEVLSVTEPNRQLAGRGNQRQFSGLFGPFANLPLGSVLMAAGLAAHLGPSHTHPHPKEAAANCEWQCSSKLVAQGQSQAELDTDLNQNPSQQDPEPTH